jgi:hypothetical protein
MRWRKRLLARPVVQAGLARLIALWLLLVHRTSRWTVVGMEHLDQARADGRPVLAAFWHGRMMMMRFLWVGPAPFAILISGHRDGRLIARAIGHLGIGTIAGSTSRDGAAGLRGVLRALAEGTSIAITPDGPRGPRFVAKPGIAAAARMSGLAVLPVAFAARRRSIGRSWDRLILAWPFNRCVHVIGAPVAPTDHADDAELTRAIEAALRRVTDEADRLAGATPVAGDASA